MLKLTTLKKQHLFQYHVKIWACSNTSTVNAKGWFVYIISHGSLTAQVFLFHSCIILIIHDEKGLYVGVI